MIRRLVSALSVATALLAVPAAAQETGSLITHKAAQIDKRGPDGARRVMEDFSACLVSRSPGRAAKIVNLRVDTPEYQATLRDLFDRFNDECLSGGDLSFNIVMLRGAVFQALYGREFKNEGPVTFDAALDTGYRALYPDPISDEARMSLALNGFGECVARADGANVRKLVRTIVGSDIERAALAALGQHFGACVPQGEKIAFSKAMLKGVMAEGIYRLSVASEAKATLK